MGETVSVRVTGSNGQDAGYAYFNRLAGGRAGSVFKGTGENRVGREVEDAGLGRRTRQVGTRPSEARAGVVRRSIQTAGAHQAARTSRAFRNVTRRNRTRNRGARR